MITVGREFGSGGHVIAKAIAERMGIRYCVRKLLDEMFEGDEKKISELPPSLVGDGVLDVPAAKSKQVSIWRGKPGKRMQSRRACLGCGAQRARFDDVSA